MSAKNRVDLRADQFGFERHDCADADGVLCRNRGDRRGAVDAMGGESFQIGLDAGAGAGVRARDGEGFADGHNYFASRMISRL